MRWQLLLVIQIAVHEPWCLCQDKFLRAKLGVQKRPGLRALGHYVLQISHNHIARAMSAAERHQRFEMLA
jgi:hypothetical protein